MHRLHRVGYGANFNDIYITDCNKYIIKRAKNKYGYAKITKEIIFYKFLEKVQHCFPVPTISQYVENGYTMNYYRDYVPLYTHFPSCSVAEKSRLLTNVNEHLCNLHNIITIPVGFDDYYTTLMAECRDKLQQRHTDIAALLESYAFITHVNNVRLLSFDEIVEKLQTKLSRHVAAKGRYEFVLIHGDCQFNNILYNIERDVMVFIDPRGYFGPNGLFGIAEYDGAKVKFALSGYDVFDNMVVSSLKYEGCNLELPNLFQVDAPLGDDYESAVAISIWMANAHMFKDNLSKMVFSHFYARYLASLYL